MANEKATSGMKKRDRTPKGERPMDFLMGRVVILFTFSFVEVGLQIAGVC
jgi:hypothetical protein